jgi:hypothetical protein
VSGHVHHLDDALAQIDDVTGLDRVHPPEAEGLLLSGPIW